MSLRGPALSYYLVLNGGLLVKSATDKSIAINETEAIAWRDMIWNCEQWHKKAENRDFMKTGMRHSKRYFTEK